MATATSNLVHDNSTLANFQAWAQFIFNAFNTTAGWTQTTDTGQTAPSAAASVGTFYFIFKMSDALQASCPTFVKITYGTNGTTVKLTVQVGQGTDGAGNLTLATTNTPGNNLTANQGASTFPCYASGDSGSIRIFMWQSASLNTGFLFGVERSKNSSGANTGGYVTFVAGDANNGSGGTNWCFQSLVAGNPNPSPNWRAGVNNGGLVTISCWNVSQSFNGTVSAFPVIPLIGSPGNPMLDWAGCSATDVTEGATNITVSIYGANHNYVSTKQGLFSTGGLNSQGQQGILMRYE